MKIARAAALLWIAAPAFGQYAGPAILARGEAPAAMAAPVVTFRPFVEFSGIYDTGLAGVAVSNAQGDLANASSIGAQVAFGISGAHSWRHTMVGLNYRGSISHYPKDSFHDGLNQSLLLGVSHQFTRHISLSLRESAGIFYRDFGLLGLHQTVPFDPSSSQIPTTDFFDNRTAYIDSGVDLKIEKTRRLSFNLGGDFGLISRRSSALHGSRTVLARGDVQYRVTARSTIGVMYNFEYFDYTGVFGNSEAQGVAGSYAIRLSRRWEFSSYAGFFRVESKFIQAVAIDPVIAALLGISQSAQISHSIKYAPNVDARLSRVVHNGVIYASGGHTILPGNGLFLTSFVTKILGGYQYTGLRRWTISAQSEYTRSTATGQIAGGYGERGGGMSVARRLGRSAHLIAVYNARDYYSGTFTRYNRLIHEARIGIGFAPGEVPLRVW